MPIRQICCLMLSAFSVSCMSGVTPINSNQSAEEFTDSVIFLKHHLQINWNNLGLFDTTFRYRLSSCAYSLDGYKSLNTNYELVTEGISDWFTVAHDPALSMTIFVSKPNKSHAS